MMINVTFKDIIVLVLLILIGVGVGYVLFYQKPVKDTSLIYQQKASELNIKNKELKLKNDSLALVIDSLNSKLIKPQEVKKIYAKIKKQVDSTPSDSLLRYIRSKVSGYVPDSTGN